MNLLLSALLQAANFKACYLKKPFKVVFLEALVGYEAASLGLTILVHKIQNMLRTILC